MASNMYQKLVPLLALWLVAAPASAEGAWRIGAAVGYGERTNPIAFADDLPIALDLDIAWFGERFFFDNGDIGYTFLDNAAVTASAVARARSERVFFGRSNLRFVNIDATGNTLATPEPFEVPDRDFAGELGVEVLADGSWGLLQINAFHDFTGVHDGFEIAADYAFGFGRGHWYFEPGVSIAYKSADLNDYYWGVRPAESSEVLASYQAGDGVNVGVSLRTSYFFSKNWALRLAVDYEHLNAATADSPIVAEDAVLGWFAGLSYRF